MLVFEESEFLVEKEVPKDELIISRTDLQGRITYANETFCAISGYREEELLGQPHSIVRHPDMPSSVFEELWRVLRSHGQWRGVVKNLRKDKGFYWVEAIVSGVYKNGELIGYKSLRSPICFEDKLKYQKLYDTMRQNLSQRKRKIIYEE